MKFTETSLPGVIIIDPDTFIDDRGFFLETYSEKIYQENGINMSFVQDNHSRSSIGVLRGLHYQLNNPQGKLVRCLNGSVFDVAVDIRRGSKYFGHYASIILSDENKKQFWIPPGFAHGFCVLSEKADFEYKCTAYYDASDQYSIAWNDPSIGIDWPISTPSLSKKDEIAEPISEINHELFPILKEG